MKLGRIFLLSSDTRLFRSTDRETRCNEMLSCRVSVFLDQQFDLLVLIIILKIARIFGKKRKK